MNSVAERIKRHKIVPVIVPKDREQVTEILDALMEGGLPVAEITFRTEVAKQLLEYAAENYRGKGMLVGAGTVINAAQARAAAAAGAEFIVGPGFSEEVADVCVSEKLPYIPGCCTPTEIIAAIKRGITLIKFFPANLFGGLAGIKALSAAFPQAEFLPTGGVDGQNLGTFLAFDKVAACGGSWMTKGSYAEIVQKVKAAVSIAAESD